MRAIRIKTGIKYEANVGAIKRAIGHETCMVFELVFFFKFF